MRRSYQPFFAVVVAVLALLFFWSRRSTSPAHEATSETGRPAHPRVRDAGAREDDDDDEDDLDRARDEAHAEPHLVRGQRSMMSTIYQMTIVSDDEPGAHAAMEAAFDEIDRLENVLSEWREGTEISQINAAAGHEAVHVSEDTETIVRAGLEVSRWSDGAFDLSWAALRGMYLFQPGQERVPSDEEIAARLPLVNFRDIELDETAHTVRLAREGMAIGTGGIAKGYALDRARDLLLARGFTQFMIFGGGQVTVHGLRGDRPWRVGIQHPRREDYIGFFETDGGSIATSGDYEHYFIDDEGRRWHHIIDLETGRPATRSMQVSIITDQGIYADAMTKPCFVWGPERCLEWLADRPGHPDAVIVDADMRVWMTPGARERVRMHVELDETGHLPH
ncbi:MAG: FAD:protein FMN transferase [Sandaracinus sp.]